MIGSVFFVINTYSQLFRGVAGGSAP